VPSWPRLCPTSSLCSRGRAAPYQSDWPTPEGRWREVVETSPGRNAKAWVGEQPRSVRSEVRHCLAHLLAAHLGEDVGRLRGSSKRSCRRSVRERSSPRTTSARIWRRRSNLPVGTDGRNRSGCDPARARPAGIGSRARATATRCRSCRRFTALHPHACARRLGRPGREGSGGALGIRGSTFPARKRSIITSPRSRQDRAGHRTARAGGSRLARGGPIRVMLPTIW